MCPRENIYHCGLVGFGALNISAPLSIAHVTNLQLLTSLHINPSLVSIVPKVSSDYNSTILRIGHKILLYRFLMTKEGSPVCTACGVHINIKHNISLTAVNTLRTEKLFEKKIQSYWNHWLNWNTIKPNIKHQTLKLV